MTINYCFQFLSFLSRKNQFGGQISPLEVQLAITAGQKGYYEFLMGRVQQFTYGKPIPKVGLGMGTKIELDLSPFKVDAQSATVTSNIVPYPTNFNFLSLMTDSSGRKIERLADSKLPGRLNSKIDPITDSSKGFYTIGKTGWNIYPQNLISTVFLYYYTKPVDVIFNWYPDPNTGLPVYNPIGSVDPQFNDIAMEEVLGRACTILGFSFEQQSLVEFGKEVLVQGE